MDPEGNEMKFDLLPADCIGSILTLSSPRDACRASTLSSSVQAAASSDSLWEKFLPPDYEEILARSTSPVPEYESKKELFLWLCSPILLDGGRKVFYLDKSTSKKCYFLRIARFGEVAELISTWWLEISGSIKTRMLSPDTSYGAYLVFKFSPGAHGLDSIPAEASVEVGDQKSGGPAQLSSPDSGIEEMILPCEREDGWLEIWLGDFKTNDVEEEVKMSYKDVEGTHLKAGLLVEGIEIRSK